MGKSFIAWVVFFCLVFWALYGMAQAQFQVIYAVQDLRNHKIVEIMNGK
jgi:multisubunit Na+/H+ antiporter MnhE subunit